MNKDLVKTQFGAAAASYAVSKVHAQGASLARLVELIDPQPHWQVLDVATGAGHTAFAFAPHVAAVTATDITAEMLATTARLAQEKGLTNLTVQEADAEALPFADGAFDLVTCRIAPHHFPHVARFVQECVRVLRPGGSLAVVDNVVPGSLEQTEAGAELRAAGDYINAFEKLRDPSHERCLSLAEWVELFQQAGLTLLHQEIQPKAMELIDWAGRMKSGAEQLPELRRRLLAAPAGVTALLQPTTVGDDVHFLLAEAIVIGRK